MRDGFFVLLAIEILHRDPVAAAPAERPILQSDHLVEFLDLRDKVAHVGQTERLVTDRVGSHALLRELVDRSEKLVADLDKLSR